MTATTFPTPTSPGVTPAPALTPSLTRSRWSYGVADATAVMWRNLLAYVRLPEMAVFSSIQPIMFVLLFRYVFGNSIVLADPSIAYVDYLLPGIMVQTAVFGAMATGIGLAEDLHKGLIERFRSLPMARSAVLAGRTMADSVRNVFVMVLVTVVGMMVGFRIHDGLFRFLFAIALVLLFAFAVSWMAATVGLGAPNAEAAQAAMFPLIFPLIFASSAFVDTAFMPGWLQAFANHQPVTYTVNAARDLVLGLPAGGDVLASIAWSVGILAVFVPLAVRRYRRAA